MKINEVEAAVGITKKNIRFYEEQGLLQPGRGANGYRDYSEQDVTRLRTIKLMRKLDVPVAEIRPMLNGERTLTDGMRRHSIELESRRKNLDSALELCRRLGQSAVTLEQLDAQDALQMLEQYEQEGVRFVDLKQTDTKAKKMKGAALGAGIFIVLMAAIVGLLLWANTQEPLPLPAILFLVAMPIASIAGVLVVLKDRIQEIRKGEADDYRDY